MGLASWSKIALALARTGAGGGGRDRAAAEVDEREETNGDLELTSYRPRRGAGPTLVLLHGFTLNGKDDPRLRAFARNLARAGAACVVPTLPGLQRLCWEERDVDLLTALLDRQDAAGGVGLVGFSFGASYALLAAARVPERVRFVVAVGGYADLPEVYAHMHAVSRARAPSDEDTWCYLRLGTAFRLRDRLGLVASDQEELRQLLIHYCEGDRHAAAEAWLRRTLAGHDLETLEEAGQDRAILERLSLLGRLAKLACRVVLVHDPHDSTVPAAQAYRLRDELARASRAPSVKLHLTTLLSHVTLGNLWHPIEALRLLALLRPLVEA